VKRAIFLVVLFFLLGTVIFFLHRNSEKEGVVTHSEKVSRKVAVKKEATQVSSHYFNNSVTQENERFSILEKKWSDMVEKLEGILDEDFFMPVSKYNQDLAGLMVDYFINYFKKGFRYFYSSYVTATRNLSGYKLTGRLNSYEARIFKKLPGIIIRNNRRMKEGKIPYYKIEEEFKPVLSDSIKFIFFMVKRYPSDEIRAEEEAYRKGSGFYRNEKLLMRMPFVAIPVAFKIEIDYIAETIDLFFEENEIEK